MTKSWQESLEEHEKATMDALGMNFSEYTDWLRERDMFLRGKELRRQQLYDRECIKLFMDYGLTDKYKLPDN